MRVGIVCPHGCVDTIASVCNAAMILSRQGYSVALFSRQSPGFRVPAFPGYPITVRLSRTTTFFLSHTRKLMLHGLNPFNFLLHGKPRLPRSDRNPQHSPNSAMRKRMFPVLHDPIRLVFVLLHRYYTICRGAYEVLVKPLVEAVAVLMGSLRVWQEHRKHPYSCIIGIDPQGLLQAHHLARLIRVPVAYYSLELLLSSEVKNSNQKRIKRQEVVLSRKAPFVVIQDEERARLLAADNGIAPERFVFVPNAPLGKARHSPSHYWHRKLGLPPDRRIVLHAGSLGKWTGIQEIVASVPSWPDDWVLVIHTRCDFQSSKDLSRIRDIAVPNRVFLSLKGVPRQEYDVLVDGADIVVAFYVVVPGSTYTQRNIQAVGLSSGKIACALRAGLPVITNEATSIGELVERERCGVAVTSASGIGQAITEISRDYEGYSNRASRVFNTYFEFDKHFGEVIHRIASLDGDIR